MREIRCACFELIKYIAMIAMTIVVARAGFGIIFFIVLLTDILILGLLTDYFRQRLYCIAYIINSVGTLIFLVQMFIYIFGKSYLSVSMLNNIESIKDISDRFYIYIPCIIIVLAISFLPVYRINCILSKRYKTIRFTTTTIILVLLILGTNASGWKRYSPYSELLHVVSDTVKYSRYNTQIDNGEIDKLSKSFYRPGVEDCILKPAEINDKENVILIFTEGMSQNCIEEVGLMPHMADFQAKSISFDNYYNHTFATYMGLIGQLYSGYQLNNLDRNSLVSIQSIMSDNGYDTYFYNTEPMNEEFSAYLLDLGFDAVLTETDMLNGVYDSISDKDAYALLYDNALELSHKEKPFFLVIYTFGTHVNTDSPDITYNGSSNTMLNRCANVDYWFGTFFDKYLQSELFNNTLLVLTTDHAAYADIDYEKAFPQYERQNVSLDEIPLCIYYKGVTPKSIDVGGRNSVCLVPTLLDLLDLSGENYFLGSSLFSGMKGKSEYETTYQSTTLYNSTKDGKISEFTEDELEDIYNGIYDYFRLSHNNIPESKLSTDYMDARIVESEIQIDISLVASFKELQLLIWNEEVGEQKWYVLPSQSQEYTVPLQDFGEKDGFYVIHLYGISDDGEMRFVSAVNVCASDKD